MKTKILLFFLIFTFACSVSKQVDTFSTIKKEYAGQVISSQTVDKITIIETTKGTITVQEKVDIRKGTMLYYYYVSDEKGEQVWVIWVDCKSKNGYRIN